MTQQIEIIIALVIYFAICIGLGVYSMIKTRNADTHDYLTAGGNVSWVVNAVCIFAAFNSVGALMGNLGLSYANSWGYMNTLCVGTATGMFFSAMFVAGPLRNLRIATVPEFLRKRYHLKSLNIIAPVVLICTTTVYQQRVLPLADLCRRLYGMDVCKYLSASFHYACIYSKDRKIWKNCFRRRCAAHWRIRCAG